MLSNKFRAETVAKLIAPSGSAELEEMNAEIETEFATHTDTITDRFQFWNDAFFKKEKQLDEEFTALVQRTKTSIGFGHDDAVKYARSILEQRDDEVRVAGERAAEEWVQENRRKERHEVEEKMREAMGRQREAEQRLQDVVQRRRQRVGELEPALAETDECSVCLNKFCDQGGEDPNCVRCRHTCVRSSNHAVCHSCLDRMNASGRTLKCPTCRGDLNLPTDAERERAFDEVRSVTLEKKLRQVVADARRAEERAGADLQSLQLDYVIVWCCKFSVFNS